MSPKLKSIVFTVTFFAVVLGAYATADSSSGGSESATPPQQGTIPVEETTTSTSLPPTTIAPTTTTSTTSTTTSTIPAPTTTAPPPPPLAPPCSTWNSQDEANAWFAENAANHDTSNIDTNGDGVPCTLDFAPPPPAPTHAPSVAVPAATSGVCWDCLAMCESTGNWHINNGNGFYGGLQFVHSTWVGFGGQQYASYAHLASREAQIAIAEKVLAVQGPGAWPGCTAKHGVGWWG